MITFYLTINRKEISALTIRLLQLEQTIHKHCGDMEKANRKLKPYKRWFELLKLTKKMTE